MNNINKTLNKGIFTNVIYYTEFADGRKYIGQTKKGFLNRNITHLKAKCPTHYDKILQKHMDEAIIYPVAYGVEEIDGINTQDLLNGLEVAEIMLRETFNDIDEKHGLNHTTGGYSYEMSQAHKNKMSKIICEYYNSEAGQKRKENSKKYWSSEEGQKQKENTRKIQKEYWSSEEGQKQKEKLSNNNKKNMIEFWNSEEGQKQKEILRERRIEVNIEDILNCIEKYMTLKETAKELNISQTKITNELRRQGFDRFRYLRNQVISEDLIESGMTINEFAIKYNVRANDIKKALTETGKKYLIKRL